MATIALIAVSVVAHAADWSPDLADSWWPWAAIASLFVGGGAIELAVDMLFLWLFAKSLEEALGIPRFLLLFLAGGIAAAGAQELVDPDVAAPSVGVAGSIAALIGAYAVLFSQARILCWVLLPFFVTFVEVPALILAAVWLGLQALPALGQPPLAGLVGGLLFGIAAVRLLAHGRPRLATESSRPVY